MTTASPAGLIDIDVDTGVLTAAEHGRRVDKLRVALHNIASFHFDAGLTRREAIDFLRRKSYDVDAALLLAMRCHWPAVGYLR